jgi:hypothetical protein
LPSIADTSTDEWPSADKSAAIAPNLFVRAMQDYWRPVLIRLQQFYLL